MAGWLLESFVLFMKYLSSMSCLWLYDLEHWRPLTFFLCVLKCISTFYFSCVSLFMCLCFFENGNISWQEAASNIDGKSERRWKENNTLIYLVILSSETGNIKVSHENHFLFTRIKRIIWYLSLYFKRLIFDEFPKSFTWKNHDFPKQD